MKKILFLSALLFSQIAFGTNYYVSSAGNDANNGTSSASPWKTIGKVNSFNFNDYDYIFFRRGDSFYGGIIVNNNNLSFDAYGTGAKPVITGLSTVTGWVNLGGNIWEAWVTNVKSGVNLVLRNGIIQQVGRYPNTDAANGGYLTYTTSTTSSITGPAMSSTTNWTGSEVAIRINRWNIRKQKVTAHSGGLISFANDAEAPRLKYGYFFQRDSRTLDKDGEWWHDVNNKKLRMYFNNNNPGTYNIQIASVDSLLTSAYSNFSVSNLSFSGSGKYGIYTRGGTGIKILSCDVNNSGAEAITASSSVTVTVDNCTTNNSLGSGIRVISIGTGDKKLFVTNCTVDSTALIAGMETDNGGAGIVCRGGDNVNVLKNKITNSGYNGIEWQGNDVYIKYNYLNTFCVVRDDGGGIYTVENGGSSLPVRRNRNVIANIILNAIGSNFGSDDSKGVSARGLYCDLGTRNVVLDSNTVAYILGSGLHGNNNAYLTYTNNVFYRAGKTYSLQRYPDAALVRNMVIKKNISYPYRFEYRNLGINVPSLISKEADIRAMGIIDSNYFSLAGGTDTSLLCVTTNSDRSNYTETISNFSYLTGTVGIEKNSKKVDNNGTLEYNASSSPKVVSFQGLSKKDVQGNVYSNSVTIPAWSSKVLLPNGTTPATPNKVPVVNAGANQAITLPASSVTLTGTATDSDGTIASYAWTKISGPSSGTIVTPNSANTIISNLTEGIYQYGLNVTDNIGGVGKDTLTVTVNASGNLLPAINPANTVSGLDYKYYEGNWTLLPQFNTLTPIKTGTVANFDITVANRSTQYGLNFTGYINVPADGTYTFFTTSDDGSSLYIDNVLTVNNDGLHGAIEKSGTIGLKAGKHAITGLFFQQGNGSVFTVSYQSNTIAKQTIPVSQLYRINTSTSNLLPAVNPVNTVNGLDYKYYEGNWSLLPQFNSLIPIKTGTVANFDITVANRSTQYGLNFTGYINVPADGTYTFFTNSDDGSSLYIDNVLTVNNDGLHGAIEKSGTIGLKAGKHAITGLFFQQGNGSVFTVSYQSNTIAKQTIPVSQLYRINTSTSNLLPAVNPVNTVNGLDYKYYEGNWSVLPQFNTLTPIKTGTVANFNITIANRSTQYGLSFTGYINVPTDGIYTFFTTSDDGSNLYIDNVLTVNNDGVHGSIEKSGTIGLKAGKHAIAGLFFQQDNGSVFTVSYQSSSIVKQVIPSAQLYRINQAIAGKIADGNTITLPGSAQLSVVNEPTALKISCFPNPSNYEFGLVVKNGSNERIDILVMDIYGKSVFKTLGTTNTRYKFGNKFLPGIYLIKVIQGNSIQLTKVIKL